MFRSGAFLVVDSTFGLVSLLTPPMAHMGASRTRTQVRWVKPPVSYPWLGPNQFFGSLGPKKQLLLLLWS